MDRKIADDNVNMGRRPPASQTSSRGGTMPLRWLTTLGANMEKQFGRPQLLLFGSALGLTLLLQGLPDSILNVVEDCAMVEFVVVAAFIAGAAVMGFVFQPENKAQHPRQTVNGVSAMSASGAGVPRTVPRDSPGFVYQHEGSGQQVTTSVAH